jgi:hypothetical protein
MAYDINNTNTLYVGTGESQTALVVYRESSGRGTGIMRSLDGGETWDLMTSTKDWAYVTDIVVRNEEGQSVIYAGVVSGIYKGTGFISEPSDGLYRSVDGGETWSQVLPLIPGSEKPYAPSDICLSSDLSRIYVGTTYGINQNATDNDRSGAACILFSDDGIKWTVNREYHDLIEQNESVKYPGRVMLANAPGHPDLIYAIVASGFKEGAFHGYGCEFLLKSSDQGATWTELNFPKGFATLAWHAFAIEINPENPDIIWLGGLDTWRTSDGGENWLQVSDWTEMYGSGSTDYVHGDIHRIMHRPDNGRTLYIATDGGIFVTGSSTSPDNVIFYERNHNYNTLQYYTCAIDPEPGCNHYMGGLQDNGTMHYIPGDRTTFTDMLSGGDGAYCFFDPDDPNFILSNCQYTGLWVYDYHPDSEHRLLFFDLNNLGIFINPEDFNWKTNTLYANGCGFNGTDANKLGIAVVDRNGIEGDLYTIPTQTQVPFTALKWDDTASELTTRLFLGTQSGWVYQVENPVEDPEVVDLTGDEMPNGYISCIETGQTSDTLLVTFSNYGIPSVWMSADRGQSWMNIEGNLPDMPIRWGIFHPEDSRHIMLATETGIWVTENALADEVLWIPQNNGLANVRVDMIRIRESDDVVLAATHGRGLFTTTWELSGTSGRVDDLAIHELKIYPNPTHGICNLEISLQEPANMDILDAMGRIVKTEIIEAGFIHHQIDLRSETPGIYFARIETGGQVMNKRIILK